MQLDLFDLNKTILKQEDKQPTSQPALAHVDTETDAIIQSVLKGVTTETEATKGISLEEMEKHVADAPPSTSKEAYEVGNVVTVDFPTEESDFELYNYLRYYYPHIEGKKGRILKIMPYSKLQYLIEFDAKHEERTLILDHRNLVWISN